MYLNIIAIILINIGICVLALIFYKFGQLEVNLKAKIKNREIIAEAYEKGLEDGKLIGLKEAQQEFRQTFIDMLENQLATLKKELPSPTPPALKVVSENDKVIVDKPCPSGNFVESEKDITYYENGPWRIYEDDSET